jgi:hypothetical protein
MDADSYAKCACDACGARVEFPLSAAGASVSCPHCGGLTTLRRPPAEGPPATDGRGLTEEEVLSAFTGAIGQPPVSPFYKTGLVVVAFAMILLPLVYLAMIGAGGWSLYWWATHFKDVFGIEAGGTRLLFFKLVVYYGPLLVGGIIVLFMIKPLFWRPPPHAQPLALNRESEPVLFAFIERICDLVGAPRPRRIDIDCNLNAGAGFRRGMRSLFSDDLVLTIGLPLVAGMNTRELAGIIAHEFGHFTQGFAMRLTFVIRSVNGWFFRVAYMRDAWDHALEEWAAECKDGWSLIVVTCAQLGVWGTRLVLKLLMLAGHLIGCFMLRQMEYDADRYEIKVAGSAAFESATRRMHVLGISLKNSYKTMRVAFNLNHELPENFPAWLIRQDAELPASDKVKAEDTMGLDPTGLFDTHPSNGDRIRCARQAGEPGVFQLEAPATVLFSNFDVVARQVTMLHYEDDLGIPLNTVKLRPLESGASAPVMDALPEPPAPELEAALANSKFKLKSRA